MGEPVCTDTLINSALDKPNHGKVWNDLKPDINQSLACLTAKLDYYSGSMTVPYEIMDVNESIVNKQASVQIAKDRAASLQNVNSKVSYYQSWFPLARPLKHSSLPILIGLTLFMFVLLFGYLLALIGVEIKLAFPYIESIFGIRSFSDLVSKPILLLIILCVALGSLLAYFIYDKFFKKEQ
jgi:hypothetical protein